MPMTVIEIAVYAAVMTGAQAMSCQIDERAVTRCSNGLTAETIGPSSVRYGNGVTVNHAGQEFPVFSNGMKSWFSSSHWLEFSNGISVRRHSAGEYEFSNGLACRVAMPDLVKCAGSTTK